MATTRKLASGRTARTFDPELAAKLRAQPDYDPNAPLVNQKTLGASDAEYQNILKSQQKDAQVRRNMAAAAETTTASPEDRRKFMQAESNKLTQGGLDQAQTIAKRLPPQRATTQEPLKTIGEQPVQPQAVDLNAQRKELAIKQAMGERPTKEDFGLMYDMTQQDKARMSQPIQEEEVGMPDNIFQAITPEMYLQMSPEQQRAYNLKSFQQQSQMQQNMLAEGQEARQGLIDNQIQTAEDRLLEAQGREEIDERLAAMEESQQPQLDRAKRDIDRADQKAELEAQWAARSRGQGVGTGMMRIMSDITATTQDKIAAVEEAAGRQLFEYETQLLDKQDAKISQLQQKLDQKYDEKDAIELQSLQEKQALTAELIAQNPNNPQNVVEAAGKLQEQQFELEKEMRESAQANFKYMVDNFGSQYIQNMTPEQQANLEANLNMPQGALQNIGQTLDEYKQSWEEAKYAKDKEFDVLMKQADFDQEQRMFDKKYQAELNQLGINFNYDVQKLGIESAMDNASKYASLAYGTYADAAINADGSGLYFSEPTDWVGNSSVIAGNSHLRDLYPNGHQKAPSEGPNGLGGQCAYECGKVMTLGGKTYGSGWTFGMDLPQKQAKFEQYVKGGEAFYPGQDVPKVGHSILSNRSAKYGHLMFINGITPDGDYVVSEFNAAGDRRFTNNRVVEKDSPEILGFYKTEPIQKYKVAATAEKLKQDATKDNPLAKLGIEAAGGTLVGQLFGAVTRGLDKAQQRESIDATLEGVTNNQDSFQQGIEQGTIDESGQQITPERQMVRSGMADEKEIQERIRGLQSIGQTQQAAQLMQDYIYGKGEGNYKGPASAAANTEIRQLRKEYNTIAKAADDAMNYSNQLNTTWNSYKQGKIDKGVTDNALIMLFSKMLDPGSVVREGEFDRVIAGQPLMTYAQNLVSSKASGGYALDDNMRSQLVALANDYAQAQRDKVQNTQEFYSQEAEYLGISPSRVIGTYDFSSPQSQTESTGTLQEILGNAVRTGMQQGMDAQSILNQLQNSQFASQVQSNIAAGYSPEQIIQYYSQM